MRLRDMAAPPGFDQAREIRRAVNGLIASCAIFLFVFLCAYFGNLSSGNYSSTGKFIPDQLPLFMELVVWPVLCLLPMPCWLIWMLVRNISYFRSSKSYYTMKRLPSRWEYPLRCALLPVCGWLALAVAANLLMLLAGGIYLLATPDWRLPSGARESVLSIVLGGILA